MLSNREGRRRIRLIACLVALLAAFAFAAGAPTPAFAEESETSDGSSEGGGGHGPADAGDGRRGTATDDGFLLGQSEYKKASQNGNKNATPDNIGSEPEGASSSADVEGASPVVPDFITRLVRKPDHGEFNCHGNTCMASRNTCVAAPDYEMINDVPYASPRSSGPRAEGSVTYESITRDTESGEDSSNGYTCQVPSTPTPRTPAAGAAAGGEIEEPEPVVIVVTRSDFAKLPVEPSVASAGPERGWLPTGMVNVLHAESEVQTLETELLDTPVAVRAIPTSYHWDLGDGNTITTSKPGKPYPSEEVSATYSGEGWYDVTLTTTFAGQFSVDGGEWEDIDGTIEVESEPIALYSKSLESRLVNPDVPLDEDEDPIVPERTADTEGPQDPEARNREI